MLVDQEGNHLRQCNCPCVCVSVCVCVYARVHTHSLLCFDVFNSLQPWTVALQGPLSMGLSRQEN